MIEPDFKDVTTHEDVPLPPTIAPVNLRGAFIFMATLMLLLALFEGESIRTSGEKLKPGWQRMMVLAVGEPTGWVARRTHAHNAKQSLVAWARPTADSQGSADARAATAREGKLGAVLITGDSMSQPLDAQLAQAFTAAKSDTTVIRDPHLGTAISQPALLDWVGTARVGAKKWKPDAVVVLLGANEGFPFEDGGGIKCCDAGWVNEYSRRVGLMMDAWSRGGDARVYWLKLPTPRTDDRKAISAAVNRAIEIAASDRGGNVRVVDLVAALSPGDQFRASMEVQGRETIVREQDGIHLNEAGSDVALATLAQVMREDFGDQVPR